MVWQLPNFTRIGMMTILENCEIVYFLKILSIHIIIVYGYLRYIPSWKVRSVMGSLYGPGPTLV